MDLTISEFPTGARPSVPQPSVEIYTYLGEEGVRKLVNDHYDLLVQSDIRDMFPPPVKNWKWLKSTQQTFSFSDSEDLIITIPTGVNLCSRAGTNPFQLHRMHAKYGSIATGSFFQNFPCQKN
jgi:hypothetical protein